jgi:hypothetical protein
LYGGLVWEVVLLEPVEQWFFQLDSDSQELVAAAIDLLAEVGPTLGRPAVDRVKGSSLHNLKELRPGSAGGTEIRILFAFDPTRQAVLLVAGDKRGRWSSWYAENVPQAELRFAEWVDELRKEEG